MVQTIKPTKMHKNITLKAYKSNMGTKHNIYWITSTIYIKWVNQVYKLWVRNKNTPKPQCIKPIVTINIQKHKPINLKDKS